MKEKQDRQKGQFWRIVSVIAAAALLLGLVAVGLVRHYLGKIQRYGAEDDYTMSEEQIRQMEEKIIRQEREESIAASIEAEKQTTSATTAPTETTSAPIEPTQAPTDAPTEPSVQTEPRVEEDYEVVNILLIGQDRRNNYERARSDTMILCSIDKADNTVTLTSFLRDLYVQIPGHNDGRLNAAYPIGGMELLNETLKENFGVEVDANIEVDFAGFEQIIDALGGVEVEVTKEEADHLEEFYEDVHLVPGLNHMNGEAALAYSRIRYIDSDIQRSGRQRAVLNALFDKIRGANMMQMLSLVDTVLPLIKTDMSDKQIMEYVLEFFPMLRSCQIINQRVPMDGGYEYFDLRGMSTIKVYPNMTREMLESTTK